MDCRFRESDQYSEADRSGGCRDHRSRRNPHAEPVRAGRDGRRCRHDTCRERRAPDQAARRIESALAEEATIRPVIAAKLLGLSEKTVRAWAAAGVLAIARPSPRLLLDVQSVHAVSHLLRELRAAGHDRDLLDQIWHRLSDSALVNRADLRESVAQMKRGEGRVLRPLRNPAGPDSR